MTDYKTLLKKYMQHVGGGRVIELTDHERNFVIELEALSRKYSLCVDTNILYPHKEELVPEAGYVYLSGNLFWASPRSPWWKKEEGDDKHYEGRVIGKECE